MLGKVIAQHFKQAEFMNVEPTPIENRKMQDRNTRDTALSNCNFKKKYPANNKSPPVNNDLVNPVLSTTVPAMGPAMAIPIVPANAIEDDSVTL